jgi:hypothetical protein
MRARDVVPAKIQHDIAFEGIVQHPRGLSLRNDASQDESSFSYSGSFSNVVSGLLVHDIQSGS